MSYHFAEPEFLPRRALAAGSIIALHVLVAYLLVTGLIRPVLIPVEPHTAGVVLDLVRTPAPTPVSDFRPNPFGGLIKPDVPVVNLPDPVEPSRAATVSVDQLPGTAVLPSAADPIRVIGKHQLPDTEDYYPPDLRRLGVQDATNVRVCVDEQGSRQGEPAVENSSGNARLDVGALNIARHGRYARAMQGDKPVGNCYRFHIVFRMKY